MLQILQNALIPALLAGISLYALCKGVAAVMLGASETSLYTISVYSGHLGLNRTRYAVFAALCGDVAAFTASAALVRLYFPYS